MGQKHKKIKVHPFQFWRLVGRKKKKERNENAKEYS